MREFEQKRKLKKRIYSKFTTFILIIILIFLVHGSVGILFKKVKSSHDLRVAEEKFEALKEKEENLNNKIAYLNSGVGKEEIARDKFSLVKEGEKTVVILDDETDLEIIIEEKGVIESFWQRIADLFSF